MSVCENDPLPDTIISKDGEIYLENGLTDEMDKVITDEIIQKKTSKNIRDLKAFIDSDVNFITQKGDQSTNIIELCEKRTFHISESKLQKFFTLLDECHKENAMIHWQERQNAASSGIMLDFDRYQTNPTRCITERHFIKLAVSYVKLLHECIDFKPYVQNNHDFRIKVFFIVKPKVEIAQNSKYNGKGPIYKDGFHILIPEVRIDRGLKRYVQDQLISRGIFRKIFGDIDCNLQSADEMFDTNSSHVNVCFLGNSKPGKYCYVLNYGIDVTLDVESGDCNTTQINLSAISTRWNLVYELSLSFYYDTTLSPKGDLNPSWLLKRHFNYKKSLEGEIQNTIERGVVVTDDMKNTNEDLNILSIQDPEVTVIKKLLLLLDPNFARDYHSWRDVVFAIADASPNYKPLAQWFSQQRRPQSWNAAQFETLWDEATNRKYNGSPITKRSLYHWARECNPQKFKELLNHSYHQILYVYALQHEGPIEQGMVANLLHNMLGNKFVVDVFGLSSKRSQYAWFEFVVPGQQMKRGQVYKWREEADPDVIHLYMQEHLQKVYGQICDKIRDKREESKDNDQHLKFWAKVEKTFKSYTTKLYNNTFQQGVIKQAIYRFRKRGFIEELDNYDNVIGVANGVLYLGTPIKMIKGFHEYRISKSTAAEYFPYDPNNPNIKILEKAWDDTFPEPDAAWFWRLYYSTFVSPAEVDALCGIQVGGGSNGKTVWSELSAEALGDDYSISVPITLLTNEREKAKEANSALMSLVGKTQVRFSEPNGPEKLNSGRFKEMFGQQKISGRGNYGDQSNFKMTASPIVVSNYDFIVDSSDEGTWRRMRYYRMKMTFKTNPDPNNPFEKLRDERFQSVYKNDPDMLAAMLSIMVHYNQILNLKYGGIISRVPCPTIERETTEWRNRQDVLNKFITQMIVRAAANEEERYQYGLNVISNSYIDWYNTNVRMTKNHNVEQIMTKFENSALQKFLKRQIDGSIILIKHRLRESVTEPLRYGEQMVSLGEKTSLTPQEQEMLVKDKAESAKIQEQIMDSYKECDLDLKVAGAFKARTPIVENNIQQPVDAFQMELTKLNENVEIIPQGVSDSYGKYNVKNIKSVPADENKTMFDDSSLKTPEIQPEQLNALNNLIFTFKI